jgi:hypothetical protein
MPEPLVRGPRCLSQVTACRRCAAAISESSAQREWARSNATEIHGSLVRDPGSAANERRHVRRTGRSAKIRPAGREGLCSVRGAPGTRSVSDTTPIRCPPGPVLHRAKPPAGTAPRLLSVRQIAGSVRVFLLAHIWRNRVGNHLPTGTGKPGHRQCTVRRLSASTTNSMAGAVTRYAGSNANCRGTGRRRTPWPCRHLSGVRD